MQQNLTKFYMIKQIFIWNDYLLLIIINIMLQEKIRISCVVQLMGLTLCLLMFVNVTTISVKEDKQSLENELLNREILDDQQSDVTKQNIRIQRKDKFMNNDRNIGNRFHHQISQRFSRVLQGCTVDNCLAASCSQNTCTECVPNFYLQSASSCLSCGMPNCLVCNKDTGGILICQSCATGYYINQDKNGCGDCTNTLTNPPLLSHCDGCYSESSGGNFQVICTTCVKNYYLESSMCNFCAFEHCINCQFISSLVCTTCQDGYHTKLDKQTCILCAVTKCAYCQQDIDDNICIDCDIGYIAIPSPLPNFGICEACSSHCKQCQYLNPGTDLATQCFICQDGYYIDSNFECQICSTLFKCSYCLDIDNCIKCVIGYSPIQSVIAGTTKCEICNLNNVLQCTQCTSNGYVDTCKICNAITIIPNSEGICDLCSTVIDSNCLECQVVYTGDVGSNRCTKCKKGFLPSKVTFSCQSCSSLLGIALSSPQCQDCQYSQAAVQCIECATDYYPTYDLKNCDLCANNIGDCTQCFFSSPVLKTMCTSCSNSLFPSKDNLDCILCQQAVPLCNVCTGIVGVNTYKTICDTCSSVSAKTSTSRCLSCTDIISCQTCQQVSNFLRCKTCVGVTKVPTPSGQQCLVCKDVIATNCVKCTTPSLKLNICLECDNNLYVGSIFKRTCIKCPAAIHRCVTCESRQQTTGDQKTLKTFCTKCQYGFSPNLAQTKCVLT